jgi:uncharacterized protein YndB with AHSA1/START domain
MTGPCRQTDDSLGTVTRRGEVYDLVIERRIQKPVAKVWAALTVPERIADWFTPVELDLRIGGIYRLSFPQDGYSIDGVILELEPMRVLAHSWPDPAHADSVVRYELEPDGGGCRLTFTQTGLPRQYAGSIAGWHVFLHGLPGATEGMRTEWTRTRENEVLERYKDQLPA